MVEKIWDYSQHAKHYCYRPNYSDKAMDLLVSYVADLAPPSQKSFWWQM
jgi:hypothetical protein